jgi:hypothetical protein
MRKTLLSLLLATTVATPALASPQDSGAGARQERRADRSEARQERQAERSQARQERFEARQQSSQPREERAQVRQQQVQMPQQQMEPAPQRMRRSDSPVREIVRERMRDDGAMTNVNERGRPTLDPRQDSGDGVANWQRDRRDGDRQNVDRRWNRGRGGAPDGARPDRPAPPPETAYNRTRNPEWRTDWRRDHRYDWRNYRNHHRSIFRVGIYYDPFGWGYQRYGIGWRLWPSYYSSNYWLSDPYMYRLPYAPWPYRWVRYYDDALLVNTMTGQVVDVMYDFFW